MYGCWHIAMSLVRQVGTLLVVPHPILSFQGPEQRCKQDRRAGRRALWAVWLVLTMCVAIVQAQTVDPSCYGPTIMPGVVCPGEQTDPAAAINTTTIYAWTVFAQINQPAFPGDVNDTRRVWETWKNADDNSDPSDAIYLDNGHAPQPWHVEAKDSLPTKRLVPIQQLQFLRDQRRGRASSDLMAMFDPAAPLAEEVRTNRPAFNFILANKLYNRQGQYQFASANPGFDFPVASKEVKAIWLELTGGINPGDYYNVMSGGKAYVLVATHVITKDLPFWHWASFVHKDQNKDPTSGYVAPLADYQVIPASLRGTPFENYRLIAELIQTPSGRLVKGRQGAQIDWITRTGEPTVMGNPQIEKGFETKSSCITCHAHSSIGLTSDGALQYNNIPLDVGAVNPQNFQSDGVVYHPLDFLWSLRQAKNFRP